VGLKGSAGRIAPHSTLADLERCSRAHSDNGLEAAMSLQFNARTTPVPTGRTHSCSIRSHPRHIERYVCPPFPDTGASRGRRCSCLHIADDAASTCSCSCGFRSPPTRNQLGTAKERYVGILAGVGGKVAAVVAEGRGERVMRHGPCFWCRCSWRVVHFLGTQATTYPQRRRICECVLRREHVEKMGLCFY